MIAANLNAGLSIVNNSFHTGQYARTVEVVAHVFFTGPGEPDWYTGTSHGKPDSLIREIIFGPAAKSATHQGGVERDPVFRQTADSGSLLACNAGHLGANPYFQGMGSVHSYWPMGSMVAWAR